MTIASGSGCATATYLCTMGMVIWSSSREANTTNPPPLPPKNQWLQSAIQAEISVTNLNVFYPCLHLGRGGGDGGNGGWVGVGTWRCY